MDTERTNKSSLVWTMTLLLFLAIGPLYVMSIGPAFYLLDAGVVSKHVVEVLYAPLVWAAEHCDPLDYVLKRLIAMWSG